MTNPNDPAFPKLPTNQGDMGISWPGLTKREYFAALAMQGLHAMYSNPHADIATYSQKACAKQAVIMADALIAELSK